jgi:hypothetical protein
MTIGVDRDIKVANNKIIPIINDASTPMIEWRESAPLKGVTEAKHRIGELTSECEGRRKWVHKTCLMKLIRKLP